MDGVMDGVSAYLPAQFRPSAQRLSNGQRPECAFGTRFYVVRIDSTTCARALSHRPRLPGHITTFVTMSTMSTVMPGPAAIPTFGPAVIAPQKKKLSNAEMEEIKAVSLPDVKYPEPITWCKHSKIAAEETVEWVRKSHIEGMYRTPKIMQKHLGHNISDLVMLVMVDSGEREAVLMGKYTLWGLAIDDFFDPDDNDFDEDEAIRVLMEMNMVLMWCFPDDPRFRANLVMSLQYEDAAKRNELLKYMDAKAAVARKFPATVYDTNTEQTHPLVRGLGELWTEMAETAPRHFLLRWGVHNQRYVNAFFREVHFRKTDGVPSLEDYISIRREIIAIDAWTILCEYGERKYFPDELTLTPEWKRLLVTGSDCAAWFNDIFSLQKEAGMGDVYNIVIIIQHQQKCSFQEASDKAWQMTTKRLEDLERDFQALKQVTPAEYKNSIDIYRKSLPKWVWGAHHWYMARTTRYGYVKHITGT